MGSPLQSASDFFRDAIALGRRSFMPALPLLIPIAALNFFRAFLLQQYTHGGASVEPALEMLQSMVTSLLAFSVIPILSSGLLFILPVQDGYARGVPISPTESARLVFRRVGALTLSGMAQGIIMIGPPVVLLSSALSQVLPSVSGSAGENDPNRIMSSATASAAATLEPARWWLVLVNLLLVFATPLLLLEARGPVRSIGLSAALVCTRIWSEWKSFFAFGILSTILIGVAMWPEGSLTSVAAPLPFVTPPPPILLAIWSAASTTLALHFGTAGLVILFRRLVPRLVPGRP